MNSLISAYRERVPGDARSDDQLTTMLGSQIDMSDAAQKYPDFVSDYQRLTGAPAPAPEPPPFRPPIAAEFRNAVSRGVSSLKSSALGIGALAADAVGADDTRAKLISAFQNSERQAATENPATVGRLEDIGSVEDAFRYGLSKAGELVPNIGEAALFGAAGAAAGSALEPGPGTVVGGGEGLLAGFLSRQAAKSALRALVEKGSDIIADQGVRDVVKGQLESLARREAVGELEPATEHLLQTELKASARKYGLDAAGLSKAAEVGNFGALGAGSGYGAAASAQPPEPGSPEEAAFRLARPSVKLPDGSVATVRSIGVGDDRGEWVIPTIVDGQPVSNDQAIKLWKQGRNDPIGGPFKSVDEANDYAQRFHLAEEQRLAGKRTIMGDSDPKIAALIAGIGGAAGAILPASVLGKLFGGETASAAETSYVQRMARNAAEHLSAGVVGMGAMELGNIAAERYMDPARRDAPLSDEELSRIVNAAAVGGMAGAASAPFTALAKPRTRTAPVMEPHIADVTDQAKVQIEQLKDRIEANGGSPSLEDQAALQGLTPTQRNFYALVKPSETEAVTPSSTVAATANETEPTTLNDQTSKNSQSALSASELTPTVPTAAAGAGTVQAVTRDQIGQNAWDNATDNGRERLLGSREGLSRQWPDLGPDEQKTVLTNWGYKDPVAVATDLARKRAAAAISTARPDAAADAARQKLAAARSQVNQAPTIAQKLAGNYEKGTVAGADLGIPGFTVKIENARGTERSNISPEGKPWRVVMPDDYGQILGTKDRTGEPIDIHIGPTPTAERVYVVDQIEPKTGAYDEPKAMLGFESRAQAEAAYDAGFSDGSGPSRRGAVTAMTKSEFRDWLRDEAATQKPIAYEPDLQQLFKFSLPSGGITPAIIKALKTAGLTEAEIRSFERWAPKRDKAGKLIPLGDGEYNKLKAWAYAKIKAGKIPTGIDRSKMERFNIEEEFRRNSAKQQAEQNPKPSLVGLSGGKFSGDPLDLVDVENRGVERKSGRGRGSNKLAVEAWEKEREAVPGLRPWSELTTEERKNFINHHEDLAERIREASPKVEAAWFLPSGGETFEILSKRLLSDSSPRDPYAPNSKTHRLTALLDGETGKVHLVSTFQNNSHVMVSKIADGLGSRPDHMAMPLRRLLDAEMRNGEPRYSVIGSARTKELSQYAHYEFKDKASFEHQFAEPLEAAQRRVQARAFAQESKLNEGAAFRPETEQERTEPIEDAELMETPAVSPEEPKMPDYINLNDDQVKTLAEHLPVFDDLDDLAGLIKAGDIDNETLHVMKSVLSQDPHFFTRVMADGLESVLKDYGYDVEEKENATNATARKRVEQGNAGQTESDLPNPEQRSGGRARLTQTPLEAQQNLLGPPKQPAAGQRSESFRSGRAKPDYAAAVGRLRAPAEEVTSPEPDNNPQPEPQQARLLQSIHNAAARAGIEVRVVEGDKAFGAYGKDRTMLQVVGSAIGSQDVRTALHEVGHDVFANETPEMRARLVRAVDRISDQGLGVDTSADTRIRTSDPAGLGKEGVNEERLVEATAKRLQEEGFDPEQASGFAQRFVRAFKDYSLRAAMAVQRWLGFQENPELARRYFENQVRRLLAGDSGRQSYVDFIGAGKPSVAHRRAEWFPTTRSTDEAFNPEGKLQYERSPDLSVAATRFNLDAADSELKFRSPDDEATPVLRTVEAEKEAAVLNHHRDLLQRAADELAKVPELATAAQKDGKDPYDFVLKVLRISDPEKSKAVLESWRETDGSQVNFDREKGLDEFKGKANTDRVQHEAFIKTARTQAALDRARDSASQSLLEQGALLAKRKQTFEQAKLTRDDLQAIKSDTSKVVPNIERKVLAARIKAAEARQAVSSVSNAMARERLKLKAVDAIAPVVAKEYGRLSAKLNLRPDFVFRSGANYNVPETPDAKTEDLSKPKNVKKLQFDARKGAVTNQAELTEHLRKMTEFMSHRLDLAAKGDENALDIGYQTVSQQAHEILSRTVGGLDTDVKPMNRWGFTLSILADGKRMAEGIGTRAGRSAMRRLNQFVTHLDASHAYNERMGRITGQLEDGLLDLAPWLDRDSLRKSVLTPTRDKLQGQHDLEEQHASNEASLKKALFARVRQSLLTSEGTKNLRPVIDQFMPQLIKLVDHQAEMAKRRVAEVKAAGMGVEDRKLGLIVDPATGERVPATRRHLDIGAYSFPRRMANDFGTMVKALRGSGWDNLSAWLQRGPAVEGGESPETASAIESAHRQDPEALRGQLRSLFEHDEHADQVQRRFFRPLADMDTQSAFDAPSHEGEPVAPADPMLVKQSMEDAGPADPVGFAEKLFELQGGYGDKSRFVADTIGRLYQRYKEADGLYRKFEPSETAEGTWAIRGMSPDALIDARSVEHLPATWFDYHDYDRRESFSMSQRIAAQLAFGRGQQGLGADFDEMNREVLAAKTLLNEATDAVKYANPGAKRKDLDRLLKQKLGSNYEAVTRLAKNAKQVTATVRSLSNYFQKEGSPDLTLNWASRIAHTLGLLLVNKPASAINEMEQLFGLHLRYGAGGSTISGTYQTLKGFGSEVVHSLAQAVGVQMTDNSWTHRLWTDLGLTDPDAVQRLSDAFVKQMGETRLGQGLRGVSDITGLGLNRLGAKAEHTVLRPLQPFSFVAMASEKALTQGLWRMVGAHVARGMEFLRDNRALLEDPNAKLDSKVMGLTGREKFTFDRLTADMKAWNLDYTDMVRGAMERRDGTPFTNADALKLYSMGLAEVLGESSLSTMPSSSFTNSIYRVISPLMGWSFRRGMAAIEAGKTPEGKRDLASLANGLAGLSLLAAGGLGTSALVNLYSEDVLGKKRNLRSMNGPEAAAAMFENLNRVGTFGMFGEILNGFANVGTGADNRIFDLDKRVVALSAIGSLTQAISSFANQRQGDYTHVIRPILTSMGAGGALEYMQIANRALGMDNLESRGVARINAQNWLRAIGRDLHMEVREGSGGGFSPTQMSPALTHMELAAYGNNASDFQEAYREALQVAKDQGIDDPVEHVKRSFSARNPLRTVFRTAPTETDYARLLAALPDNGRRDVTEAVAEFNRFAEVIGARPFDGKPEKSPASSSTDPLIASLKRSQARSRAVSQMFRGN